MSGRDCFHAKLLRKLMPCRCLESKSQGEQWRHGQSRVARRLQGVLNPLGSPFPVLTVGTLRRPDPVGQNLTSGARVPAESAGLVRLRFLQWLEPLRRLLLPDRPTCPPWKSADRNGRRDEDHRLSAPLVGSGSFTLMILPDESAPRSRTMSSAVQSLVYETVARLRLHRWLHSALLRDRLTILMYHSVVRTPLDVCHSCFVSHSEFRSQVDYLRRHFQLLPLLEAVERMRSGAIDRPTASITFDDGFQNNHDFAFPILRDANVPATIFVTTGLVDTSETLWFCRLHRALSETKHPSLQCNGRMFDLIGPGSKARAVAVIQEMLKEFPHPEMLRELRRIIQHVGQDPDLPIEIGSPFRMLSRAAIAEMAASGLIEFGAHGHNHAILSLLSSQEQHSEIEQSMMAVRELTGRPCRFFAYPNGRKRDYDPETIKLLVAGGVKAAVTSIRGPNDKSTNVMELRRYPVTAGLGMAHFQLMAHHFIAKVKEIIGRGETNDVALVSES